MLFHIAKLAQGTDTAFRIKIQLKYHLWEEKTFFSQCEEYMYMCVCIYIYIYFFFFLIMVLTKDNHLPPIHPSAPFTRIMKIRILSFVSIT